jgi:3-hydroxy acid dehydrogenase / malonic semialdehyde reductase
LYDKLEISVCFLTETELAIAINKITNMNQKIVLITGATSGIGEACARKFAQGGYAIILTGRKADKLEALSEELQQKGVKTRIQVFDVRDREAARKAVESLEDQWKQIDVLINNAGLALGLDKEYQVNPEDWDVMIDTNVKGLLTMTRLIVPGMVRRNHGHVINIGSVAGDAAYAGGNVYCATKAAVKALTDGLRIDVADTCVRVTDIKPGLVETHFSVTRFKGDGKKADHVYQGIHPLNGDDIADVAFYAASAPEHVQIAEVLVLATHQANGTVIDRDPSRKENLS